MTLGSAFLGTLRAVLGALGITAEPYVHAQLTATTRVETLTATSRAVESFTATTRVETLTATSQ